MLVAVAPLIISAHGIGTAEQGHHAPGGIAEVERARHVPREDGTFPHARVGTSVQVGSGERIVIAKERGPEILREIDIDSLVRIGDHITRVVNE